MNPKLKLVLQHYVYAALSALLAAYAAGYHSAKDLGFAALSGLIAPILVSIDPTNALLGLRLAPKPVQVGAKAVLKSDK